VVAKITLCIFTENILYSASVPGSVRVSKDLFILPKPSGKEPQDISVCCVEVKMTSIIGKVFLAVRRTGTGNCEYKNSGFLNEFR